MKYLLLRPGAARLRWGFKVEYCRVLLKSGLLRGILVAATALTVSVWIAVQIPPDRSGPTMPTHQPIVYP